MVPACRRDFLRQTGSCAAHLALAATVLPPGLARRWTALAGGRVVAAEPFGRLEAVGDGVWALISTPLGGDFTTVANGGIVAGSSGVMVIEGLMQPAGATWLAEQARTLTGRWPTHAVLTHYHSDHVNGLAGFAAGGPAPKLFATAATRDQARDKNLPAAPTRVARLDDVVVLDRTAATEVDLGGRVARIDPMAGHTASDVVVSVAEPAVLFAGDLIWNGMFPNYVDAAPIELAQTVRTLRAGPTRVVVPGHGPIAAPADVDRYLAVLEAVEAAAREAHRRGQPATEAGAAFALPARLGEWTLFTKQFMPTAFQAWYRQLAR